VQRPTPAQFFVTRDLDLWPFGPQINGFPGLIAGQLCVTFGDPSCIGLWDIILVRTNRQTDRQTDENLPSRLPPTWVTVTRITITAEEQGTLPRRRPTPTQFLRYRIRAKSKVISRSQPLLPFLTVSFSVNGYYWQQASVELQWINR